MIMLQGESPYRLACTNGRCEQVFTFKTLSDMLKDVDITPEEDGGELYI